MKKARVQKHYVITSKETGNILVLWKEFAREGNTDGRAYVTWQHFIEFQEKIAENGELGIGTVFNSRREANKFMETYGVKNGEVNEAVIN